MTRDYQETKKRRMIARFVREEAKEYVCYCGFTGMKPKKIYFSDDIWTKVDLACEMCEEERTVTMDYPEEIIYFEF